MDSLAKNEYLLTFMSFLTSGATVFFFHTGNNTEVLKALLKFLHYGHSME